MAAFDIPQCLFDDPDVALEERDAKALLQRMTYVDEIAEKAATGDLFNIPDRHLPEALDDLALDVSVNIGLPANAEDTQTSPWLIQTSWTFVWWHLQPDEAERMNAMADANARLPLGPENDGSDAVLAWLRIYGLALREQLRDLSGAPTASEAVLHLCLIDLTLLDLARGIGRLSLRMRLDGASRRGTRRLRP